MLMKRILFVVLVTLPVSLAVAADRLQPEPVLTGPDGWVAFDARLTETTLDGTVVVTGHYYRSANGSERYDSERQTDTGVERWSSILNTAMGRRFILNPGEKHWDAYPLEPRKIGWDKPYKMSASLVKHEAEPVENLRTARVRTGMIEEVVVPELNFFAVWRSNGRQIRKYDQIRKGEPPVMLFVPPADASIREHAKPKLPGRTMAKPQ